MRKTIRSVVAAAGAAAVIAVPILFAGSASAATDGWTPLTQAPEPEANPLKGFVPFQGDFETFPHSMEWSYFPLDAVMTGPEAFDWTVLDASLDEIATRGHQTALRFYLDYPTRESGIPQFLIDGGLETRPYDEFGNDGVSVSPDYDDPQLRAALSAFIAALGDRYDGDPRVGYVQAGLIGFWGEWHTWPYNGEGEMPDWMPSAQTQQEVLDAFVAAFPETEIQVRDPNAMNASMPIGYHDDSFALSTMTSDLGWHFMDNMVRAGATEKWKDHSIGGELRPELQSCIFSAAGCPVIEEGGDNDFEGSLEQTHATWLLNHYAFQTGYTPADKAVALEASRSLGYSFTATEALIPEEVTTDAVDIGMTISNAGVAPFYYDWPISVGVADEAGEVVRSVVTDWLVSDIASGATLQFTTSIDTSGLPEGEYTLLAQVANPMAGGMPIRFANAEQDADVDGWLSLGAMSVAADQPEEPGGPGENPGEVPDPDAGGESPVSPPSSGGGGLGDGASGAEGRLAETGSDGSPLSAGAVGIALLAAGIGALAAARRLAARRG